MPKGRGATKGRTRRRSPSDESPGRRLRRSIASARKALEVQEERLETLREVAKKVSAGSASADDFAGAAQEFLGAAALHEKRHERMLELGLEVETTMGRSHSKAEAMLRRHRENRVFFGAKGECGSHFLVEALSKEAGLSA